MNDDLESRVTEEVAKRYPKPPHVLSYVVDRIIARLVRMAIGLVIAFFVNDYFTAHHAFDLLSKPLGSITLGELIGQIFVMAVVFFAYLIPLWIAFGEGKSEKEWVAEKAQQQCMQVEGELRREDLTARRRSFIYRTAKTVGNAISKKI